MLNIDRLRAGRVLDGLVEALVMETPGYEAVDTKSGLRGRRIKDGPPQGPARRFSSDNGTAFEVVEHLRKKNFQCEIQAIKPEDEIVPDESSETYRVTFVPDVEAFYSHAATLPLAICRAALKAVLVLASTS